MGSVTTSDGITLHLTEQGDGPAVLLIGSSMGASTIWSYVDLFGGDRVRGDFFAEGVPDTGRGLDAERAREGLLRLVERLGRRTRARRPTGRKRCRCCTTTPIRPGGMASREPSSRGNPAGRAVVLDDAGHATHLDRPEAVNEILLGFAAEL